MKAAVRNMHKPDAMSTAALSSRSRAANSMGIIYLCKVIIAYPTLHYPSKEEHENLVYGGGINDFERKSSCFIP